MKTNKILTFVFATFFACNLIGSRPPEQIHKSYIGNIGAQSAAAFIDLKTNEQCQTNNKDISKKVRDDYCKLIYELLLEYKTLRTLLRGQIRLDSVGGYNLERPEVVMVTNEIGMQNAYAGDIEIDAQQFILGRGITIGQAYLDSHTFGATRLILLHEIAHLSERHYAKHYPKDHPDYYKHKQLFEREADKASAIIGKCEQCARDCAEQYLLNASSEDKNSETYKKICECVCGDINKPLTLGILDTHPLELISSYIDCLSRERIAQKRTHPSSLERALRFYHYSKVSQFGICGSTCRHHALIQELSQGKKTVSTYRYFKMLKEQKDIEILRLKECKSSNKQILQDEELAKKLDAELNGKS